MQGMIRCALVAGFLCACHTDDTGTPDAPVGTAGLEIQWSSTRPSQWPGTIDSSLTLDRATFRFDSLRVIGDAGPGDPSTTATTFTVEWSDEGVPGVIDFADAPIGMYSQLALVIDGKIIEDSYEIRGYVTVSSTTYELRIDDPNPLAINLGIDKMLDPGALTTIEINVDFQHALDTIDFSIIPPDDNRIEIDASSSQIAELRNKLAESFTVTTTTAGAR